MLSAMELRASQDWQHVMERWAASPQVTGALSPEVDHTAQSLSTALVAALQQVVALAGGWVTRPPARRKAYDSAAIRKVRGRLQLLHRLESLTRPLTGVLLGCWPRDVVVLCDHLRQQGISLPLTTMVALRETVVQEVRSSKDEPNHLNNEMRRVRHYRWRDILPQLWHARPGVIHHWLQAPTAAWGCSPIVDDSGQQCTTVTAVDHAVRGYWVEQVLRQHAGVDEVALWRSFTQSEFSQFIPELQWAHSVWTGESVRSALSKLRDGAAAWGAHRRVEGDAGCLDGQCRPYAQFGGGGGAVAQGVVGGLCRHDPQSLRRVTPP